MTHLVEREYGSTVAGNGDGLSLSPALSTSANGWPLRPFQIVSLQMLLDFEPRIYFARAHILRGLQSKILIDMKPRGAGDDIASVEYFQELMEELDSPAYEDIKRLGLQRTVERVDRLRTLKPELTSLSSLLHHLRELDLALVHDLEERWFFYMPAEAVHYYNEKELFGEPVALNFPSTANDVREAGNCYATGCYTACVFHCMRVVEKGLHALVHHLNKQHNAGIVFSKTVEETNWGNIVGEIQLAVENPRRLQRLNPLPTKDEMRLYSSASKEFEYFMEAWRHDVSHSRRSYDEPSAESVMNHVKAFMSQLAIGGLQE